MSPHADFKRDALDLPSTLRTALRPVPAAGCYGMPIVGTCLGPGYPPARVIAICNPSARAVPDDLVVVWVAVPQGFVQVIPVDRSCMLPALEHELEADEDLREIVAQPGASVVRPTALPFGKLLMRELPPVKRWSANRNGALVVRQLDPHLEIVTDLAEVLAVDKVVALIELVDPSGLRVRHLPMPRRPSARPQAVHRWSAEAWVWGEEGAPA